MSRRPTDARQSFTLRARIRVRLPSRLTSPTHSTLSTGLRSCVPFASTSRHSPCESTAVTVMRAPSSPAPTTSLRKSSPAPGECNTLIPSARSFSPSPSTRPSWRPGQPRRPHTREVSISISARVPPRLCAASSSPSLMASAASDWWSTWTRPRSFPRVPPPNRSLPATSRGALGTGLPISSFWGHLSDPSNGAKSSWAAASPRPGPSCQPLVSSRTPKALSACYARAPGGPRSCTPVAPCLRPTGGLASVLPLVMCALPWAT